jgi:hypothetical protein
MAILAKFEKQPADTQDFDIDYTDWLAGLGDTASGPTGAAITVDTGITMQASSLINGVVKVWLTGGTSGTTYKITCTLTTAGGRIKQAEIQVKVKDY